MLKTFKIIGKIILFTVCLGISWLYGYGYGQQSNQKCYEDIISTHAKYRFCSFSGKNLGELEFIEFIEPDKLEEINLQNKEQTLK